MKAKQEQTNRESQSHFLKRGFIADHFQHLPEQVAYITPRLAVKPGSFGAWLRDLPLLPPGSDVRLFNGELKARQDVHAAVVDLDVGSRDLQQCADAVMRLRAEYLYARHEPVRFHPDPGKPRELAFIRRGASGDVEREGDRERFRRYLVGVFADAGSASLEAEMKPVGSRPLAPGDVLIQGGYPGHAVQVLDVAERGGQRFLLLGQSYMPASNSTSCGR